MARRKIDEKRLRELQMKQGNGRGPGSRFGGLKEKPKDLKKTLKQLMKYIGYSKKLLIGLIIVVIFFTIFVYPSYYLYRINPPLLYMYLYQWGLYFHTSVTN